MKIETLESEADSEGLRTRRLTPEEKACAFEALEHLRQLERELRQSRPGYRWTPVDELIREAKEQRDRRSGIE